MVFGNAYLIGVKELFHNVFIITFNPAGGVILGRFKSDRNVELGADTVSHNLKLQGADNADNPFGADNRFENAGTAFFGNLLQGVAEVFGFERIKRTDAFQKFRRKARNTGKMQFFAFGQGVADTELSVVGIPMMSPA